MSLPGRAGRGVVGRGERIAVGRAGRVARPAGTGTVIDIPGLEPEGDTERSTPSPTSDEFMAGVMQKSPVTSPPDGTTPEDSPGGSPKAPGSPTSKMKDLRIKDKLNEEDLVRVNKVYGSEGTQVSCEVNYVKVMTGERSGPFIYHVRFTPEIESLKVTQDIIRKNPNVVAVIGNVCAFTGMNLYLPKVLPKPITDIEAVHPENPSVSVTVTIEFLKKPKVEELIPFYNTLLRRAMRELQLVQIKHHYFMPNERIGIPALKLEVWPGYVSKIIELDGGLLLCCEVTHRVLRTSTALEMMRNLFRTDKNNFKQNALKQLVGCVVLTRYNNKPYRIDDINFNQNALSTFEKADGTVISYKEYLKNSWNETITDDKQPVLIHQPKPRKGETTQRTIVLLPELCFMTGLTDDIRSDVRAMRDIASHTRIPPQIRHAKLLQYLKSLDSNETAKKIFTQWNICLDNKPYEVPARVFPNEVIRFGKRQVTVNDEVTWSREAASVACYASYHLSDWLIVVPNNEGPKVKEVYKQLEEVSRKMGFRIELPTRKIIDNDSAVSYVRGIREAVRPTTQLIFILTPGAAQREDRYNAIKKLSCCELAIPSQVVRVATLSNQNKFQSICQKVALQMQCKIGGQPWIVPIPFKAAMFVGIDVYHDPNRQSKSCVAMVASMNPECSQWFSRVFFQGTSEEIAETIGNGLAQCAKKFADKVGVIPDRVFVYRDGVGDGQIPVVQSYEVPQMKNALCSVDKTGQVKPKLSCIVVQKRVDTRMILRAGQNFGNPKSGTVLDRGVTRVNYTDFFLISQHVKQGTVTPTHYIVAKDEGCLATDKMQRLTYRMTFLYYNWAGCVRVPAPCQYAHKIAYLAGQNLFAPPKDSICDKLFFL